MNKKIFIGIALIGIFLLPIGSQMVAADTSIGHQNANGIVTITTGKMTIKLIPDSAHLMWYYGNHSDADEMFKLQLLRIREYMGDDDTLDAMTELGGLSYNLVTEDWDYEIVEGDGELTITLSLLGLANGANIYLIMHVYEEDEPIEGSDQVTDGLTELKFDIIVEDWTFSPMAKGYAIHSYLTEVQKRNRVQVRNGTGAENGNTTRTMQFDSDDSDIPAAYYEWATTADIYNSTEHLVDTIDVGTAYFDDLIVTPTDVPGFADGLGHLWLTYPKYGDDLKMVHDPTIGINVEAYTAPLYLLPIFAGLFTVSVIALVVKKRKA
ncbi:MAG: hypothetical protein ACTSQK_11960 [Candidatus Heimdallarchaeota archaeon]